MKIPLKTLLVTSFSFMMIFSISMILFTTYFTTKNSMNKQSSKIMKNISEFTIDKSKSYMNIATNAAILTKNLQKKSVINTSSEKEIIEYFYEQMLINNQFSAIYYANTEGDFIMLLKNKNGYLKKFITFNSKGEKIVKKVFTDKLLNTKRVEYDSFDKYDPRIRPWFVKAVEEKKLIWTDPYVFFTSKKPGISTSTPIFNEVKRVQGVVGIDIEIDELSSFVNSLKISDNGKVFIMDKSLKMISLPIIESSKDVYKIQTLNDLNSNSIIKKAYEVLNKDNISFEIDKEKFISFSLLDKDYQAMFLPLNIGELEWVIGMYALEDDFLGLLKKNNKLNILFIILIGLLTLYIIIKISEQIFKPIIKLGNMTKELKSLNLNQANIDSSKIKEIDELISSFNKMKGSLRESYTDTLHRLAIASEYKDTDTSEHINRIGLYCEVIAKKLNLAKNEIYILKNASAMHDIGKLGVPDNVLLKPGKLNSEERKIIETHPAIGATILKNPTSKIMEIGAEISLYHHEKWDGTGYPKKLKGEEIPLHARIVAIVDVFDALLSKRCYKEPYSFEKTKRIILEGKGSSFDPKLVDIFEECFDELVKISKNYS